jgi:hypothetical protein
MKMTKEMEKDVKHLADVIDALQKKYDGIYITACHLLGETEVVADVMVSHDNKDFARMIKWGDGKYSK